MIITGSLIVSSSTIDLTGATAISGSTFSGSFAGDGAALTGVGGGFGDGTALDMEDALLTRPKLKDYSMEVKAHTPVGTYTGWDYATESYESKSYDLTSQSGNPRGIFFKPDGLKMYVVDDSTAIFQYSLSVAWDVSTASYDSKTKTAEGGGPSGRCLWFKPDGTEVYFGGSSSVYQCTLSTPWDISTCGSASTFSHGGTIGGIAFSTDGVTMIVMTGGGSVYDYSLTSAWDVTTAGSSDHSYNPSSQVSTLNFGMVMSEDGAKIGINRYDTELIYLYTLSTPFDVSTMSYDSVTMSYVAEGQADCYGAVFSRLDGAKQYVAMTGSDIVYQYDTGTEATEPITIDVEDGNYHTVTTNITGLTFTFSNPPASESVGYCTLELTSGSAGTVTWPSSVDWSGGTAPTLSATGPDILEFFTNDAGTTWYGRSIYSTSSGGGFTSVIDKSFHMASGATEHISGYIDGGTIQVRRYVILNAANETAVAQVLIPADATSIDSVIVVGQQSTGSHLDFAIAFAAHDESQYGSSNNSSQDVLKATYAAGVATNDVWLYDITSLITGWAAGDEMMIGVGFPASGASGEGKVRHVSVKFS